MRTSRFSGALAVIATAAAPASAHFYLRFSDQTAAAGLSTAVHTLGDTGALSGSALTVQTTLAGGGCADFDNDGDQDLFHCGGGGEIDRLYWNQGDGTFVESSNWWVDAQGMPVTPDQHVAGGIACGDYDDDGWIDFFAVSLGPANTLALGDHRLFHNNGDGTFTDVAAQAGVNFSSVLLPDGTTPTWCDYDLDGDLDLYVAGWRVRPIIPVSNRLFRNDGDGTFTDVTVQAGVQIPRMAGFTPIFCDMDGDRYPELLMAADLCFSRYFVNDGDGTFTLFTAQSGTAAGCSDMGAAVGDWNGDGNLDWYVTQANSPNNPLWDGNHLYLGNGDNTFVDLGQSTPVYQGGWGWGTVSCDFNHDERLDLLEVNGFDNPPIYQNVQAFLYMQTPTGNFVEAAYQANFLYPSNGRGIVLFDADNDVDMDVFILNHDEPAAFWRNDLADPDTHAIRVFLDTSGNPGLAPHGIGTKITATTPSGSQIFAMGTRTTMVSQGEHSAHFGLGSHTAVDLSIEWTDGSVTTMNGVAADQTITVSSP